MEGPCGYDIEPPVFISSGVRSGRGYRVKMSLTLPGKGYWRGGDDKNNRKFPILMSNP